MKSQHLDRLQNIIGELQSLSEATDTEGDGNTSDVLYRTACGLKALHEMKKDGGKG